MPSRSTILSLLVAGCVMLQGSVVGWAQDKAEFFEKKIRPVLVEHCYKCHSGESNKLKGGLRLDLKAGWQAGGESGEPSIVPGKPDESLLIRAVRHDDGASAMPPEQSRLPDAVIANLVAWVQSGSFDLREGTLDPATAESDWEAVYQQRLKWWSLQPVVARKPPVTDDPWVRNDVDRFILAGLSAQNLKPVEPASRRTLARRLSFALTGLPPCPGSVECFVADSSPEAYEKLVQTLLDSPHFGEHWARHWMDVVHYSDTHGYEWDAPAKHAWRYRDYLIRAFNSDVPYQRMVLEQIAGDLLEPRVDPQSGINESLIGPMALRLGERRHGDNAAAEGVSQEAIANIIDTVSKGFLATTVACAQCHDHKLDAIAQRDYYALVGVFMSTRWGVRTIDAVDPNVAVLDELRRIKRDIRCELGKLWLGDKDGLMAKIQAIASDDKTAATMPNSLAGFWHRAKTKPVTPDEFAQERKRRIEANKANLKLIADFTRTDGEAGWQWDGFGMQHGLVRDGEIVIAEEGDSAVDQVLPAGRWSHTWSKRLAGAVRSPMFPPNTTMTLSVGFSGGKHVAQSVIVDQAFHSERMKFLNQPVPDWLTVTAGNFDSLEGSIDRAQRRVFVEFVTKSLNNYFPPRTGYGGLKEDDIVDQRSWFGVTRVFEHPPGNPPLDELARFAALFAEEAEGQDSQSDQEDSESATGSEQGRDAPGDTLFEARLSGLLFAAVRRFSIDEADAEDARLIDDAIRTKLLINDLQASPELTRLVNEYRNGEKRLQPDRTIGSAAEWHEARNERIGIRGSYTEFGDEVPRHEIRSVAMLARAWTETSKGQIQIPSSVAEGSDEIQTNDSTRLELARSIASNSNPLTARVYVNRVWQHLFGEGLVRTPDDFGHLGQQPTHPELLDFIATQFAHEGWSTKKLIRLLVTSATWQQSSLANPQAVAVDPENRLWHYIPMRRLEAEAIRDSILAASGRLDATLFGPPIDPYRTAQDSAKRLFSGPLDGLGRRSIYTKMTLMEPPRLLALFNQPIPMLTVGRRDVTSVPDQALALLNDPFVVAMAKYWSQRLLNDDSTRAEQRAERMFAAAFARLPESEETTRLVRLAQRSAKLRKEEGPLLMSQGAWLDVAHAIFNLQEFVYVQ